MLPAFILESLSDEVLDEQKLNWHSSSGRIIHLWYKNGQLHKNNSTKI